MTLTPLGWISSVLLWTCRGIMRGILRTLAVNLRTSRVRRIEGRKQLVYYAESKIFLNQSSTDAKLSIVYTHLTTHYYAPLIHETRGHRQSTIELFLNCHLSNLLTYYPPFHFQQNHPIKENKENSVSAFLKACSV